MDQKRGVSHTHTAKLFFMFVSTKPFLPKMFAALLLLLFVSVIETFVTSGMLHFYLHSYTEAVVFVVVLQQSRMQISQQ